MTLKLRRSEAAAAFVRALRKRGRHPGQYDHANGRDEHRVVHMRRVGKLYLKGANR